MLDRYIAPERPLTLDMRHKALRVRPRWHLWQNSTMVLFEGSPYRRVQ